MWDEIKTRRQKRIAQEIAKYLFLVVISAIILGWFVQTEGFRIWINNYANQTHENQTFQYEKSNNRDIFGRTKINISELEIEIHESVNNERTLRGLPPLEWNEKLSMIAREHSEDMAQRGYFSHMSPEGHDFSYRYAQEGFVCNIPSGSIIYMGAENLFQNNLYRSITYINAIPFYDWNTQTEIAQSTVSGWMSSYSHRQNILTPYWQSEGIGMAIAEDSKVYVTQNFC